jgi:hypothetical protein
LLVIPQRRDLLLSSSLVKGMASAMPPRPQEEGALAPEVLTEVIEGHGFISLKPEGYLLVKNYNSLELLPVGPSLFVIVPLSTSKTISKLQILTVSKMTEVCQEIGEHLRIVFSSHVSNTPERR